MAAINISALEVSIDKVKPDPNQPRKEFSEENLVSLADSIMVVGVIEPIIVAENGDGTYTIRDGERRWRASKKVGRKTIPAVVAGVEATPMQISLIANLQKQDLNPMEIAEGYEGLRSKPDGSKLPFDEVGRQLGIDQSTVANYVRLLELPDEIKGLIREGKVSYGHARLLPGVKSRDAQIALARRVAKGELSVRKLEKEISKLRDAGKPKPGPKAREASGAAVVQTRLDELSKMVGVDLWVEKQDGGKPGVVFMVSKSDELEKLLMLLLPSSPQHEEARVRAVRAFMKEYEPSVVALEEPKPEAVAKGKGKGNSSKKARKYVPAQQSSTNKGHKS